DWPRAFASAAIATAKKWIKITSEIAPRAPSDRPMAESEAPGGLADADGEAVLMVRDDRGAWRWVRRADASIHRPDAMINCTGCEERAAIGTIGTTGRGRFGQTARRKLLP